MLTFSMDASSFVAVLNTATLAHSAVGGRPPHRRGHACEWSTDRAIRGVGIDKMSQNATGSSRRFRPRCALWMSPVNALQHIGEVRRRDDNGAIGRRGPDKLAALQPLGVQRHAQTVMPKYLHEVAPACPRPSARSSPSLSRQNHHLQSVDRTATSGISLPLEISHWIVSWSRFNQGGAFSRRRSRASAFLCGNIPFSF
jgi:hypothetical protein